MFSIICVVMDLIHLREVATLNEFREFFGLEKHKHFEDINKDKEISGALRDLYEDPDMVELYPGLMCEGEGRCLDPGVTGPNSSPTALWAGVFSDAVTLVRSDRFYTVVSELSRINHGVLQQECLYPLAARC